MEYKIMESSTSFLLQKIVNEKIKEGWLPLGGICARTISVNGIEYSQAITKECIKPSKIN